MLLCPSFHLYHHHHPHQQWSIPTNIEISAECRDLLTRMLVRDPDERITMAQIHKHPWFIANLPMEVSKRGRAGRKVAAELGGQCACWCWLRHLQLKRRCAALHARVCVLCFFCVIRPSLLVLTPAC